MDTPTTRNPRAPSIQFRDVARRRCRLSRGGSVPPAFIGAGVCYVHSSLWAAALSPRVCTSGKAAGGREHRQAMTHGGPPCLWFSKLRSAQHRTYSVPNGRSRLYKRSTTGQPKTLGKPIYTDHASRGTQEKHVGSRAKRKMKQPPGMSLWWLFHTSHATVAAGEGIRSSSAAEAKPGGYGHAVLTAPPP